MTCLFRGLSPPSSPGLYTTPPPQTHTHTHLTLRSGDIGLARGQGERKRKEKRKKIKREKKEYCNVKIFWSFDITTSKLDSFRGLCPTLPPPPSHWHPSLTFLVIRMFLAVVAPRRRGSKGLPSPEFFLPPYSLLNPKIISNMLKIIHLMISA